MCFSLITKLLEIGEEKSDRERSDNEMENADRLVGFSSAGKQSQTSCASQLSKLRARWPILIPRRERHRGLDGWI